MPHPPENKAFQDFLDQYQIKPLDLSVFSEVRYLTIWQIMQGHPVDREKAEKVIRTLKKMAGVAYTGTIAVLPDHQTQQQTTRERSF